jgi:transcriptional regulator
MYLPSHFKPHDETHALALMREHPLASLISQDEEGAPYVSHLPLHLQQRDAVMVLQGHCAKANPHWRYLQARPHALVTFMGPQAYLSPKVYPDLARVPTWNYLAVHARVQATVIDNTTDKDALLKSLIADHEPAYADQWRGLDGAFQDQMLSAIVAFELRITDLQCKLKLNQHRASSHAALYAMYRQGTPEEQALAGWMVRLGLIALP